MALAAGVGIGIGWTPRRCPGSRLPAVRLSLRCQRALRHLGALPPLVHSAVPIGRRGFEGGRQPSRAPTIFIRASPLRAAALPDHLCMPQHSIHSLSERPLPPPQPASASDCPLASLASPPPRPRSPGLCADIDSAPSPDLPRPGYPARTVREPPPAHTASPTSSSPRLLSRASTPQSHRSPSPHTGHLRRLSPLPFSQLVPPALPALEPLSPPPPPTPA